MVFVGILHIGDNGVFELCAFSQDPERLPCVRWEFWHPDRVFCTNLVTGAIRERAICVSFPRTPKGSPVYVGRFGILTARFVGILSPVL